MSGFLGSHYGPPKDDPSGSFGPHNSVPARLSVRTLCLGGGRDGGGVME